MKRFTTLATLVALIVLLAQCSPKTKTATTVTSPAPAKTDESVVKKQSDDIAAGKIVFDMNCGKCHKFKMPETLTTKQWDHILPGMSRKSNLNETQSAQVHAYVYANAKPE